MPPRLVGDELDLDLPALTTGLVVVVVVVVGSRAGALHAAAGIERTVAIASSIVVRGGRVVLVVFGDFTGHGDWRGERCV